MTRNPSPGRHAGPAGRCARYGETRMKITIFAALLMAAPALADDGFDRFGGAIRSGAFSASGFANAGQSGDWSVGAMNDSYGFSAVRETQTGVELSTSGGSVSEGFGSRFRGVTGAAGSGFGDGRSRFRGRF